MSELITFQTKSRLQLLGTVSAISLLLVVSSSAKAENANRPTVWIEVGGQLNRLADKQEIYSPPFLTLTPPQFDSPLPSMRSPLNSIDVNGAISILPRESNWSFSASIRYGRSGSANHFHQQSYPSSYPALRVTSYQLVKPFAAQGIDANSKNSENHAILDFEVGRDVGVGLFGGDSSSSLGLGVRFAQFQSRSRTSLHEDPDWHFIVHTYTAGPLRIQGVHQAYHTYAGEFEAERSFHGVGPSLSWKSTVPVAGNTQDGALALDWGANASVLFGRQRSRTQHDEMAQYHAPGFGLADNPGRSPVYHHPSTGLAYYSTRSRSITVPNIGGFAGLSWRMQNFKMSLGYRADFFFGAIDGGIDTRKSEDRNFYGPFATISIGLGG